MMACDNDPKSIQYLDCRAPEASRYADLLTKQTRANLNRTGNYSCVFIKYKIMRDMIETHDQMTIRSCVNTTNDWCGAVVEKLVQRRNVNIIECNQCRVSFCNSGDLAVESVEFLALVLLLSLLAMS
ncbi:hypothetical protein Trydic_g5304, partial [Trypoxylus dichotomus]